MRSIKNKIIFIILSTVIILSITLGTLSCVFNYKSSMSVLSQTMIETALTASNQVTSELKAYTNITFEAGCIARLTNKDYGVKEKEEIINQKVKYHNFQRGNIIGIDGISIFDGNDYSERDYFKKCMKGDIAVSDPLVSKVTGKMTIIIAAPIWKDGIPKTQIEGVIYFVPNEDFLNNIVNSIKIGKTGYSYLINSEGVTIAHNDTNLVSNKYNSLEEAKKDSSLKKLAEFETKLTNGEKGFGKYKYNNQEKVISYAPVPSTNGWGLIINVSINEFLQGMRQSIFLTIIIVAIFIIIGIFIALSFGNKIAIPIKDCANRLQLLANGDFKTSVPKTSSKDETFVLLNSLEILVNGLDEMVEDISYHLGEMAKGNLCTVVKKDYKGNFKTLEISIKKIISSFNEAMSQINQSADQVASASDQVSSGAQALSKGAVEQADSIGILANNIKKVSENVKDTDLSSIDARYKTVRTNEEIKNCNIKMEELIKAMSEINGSSGEIGKIIKTIEDIAFQTNILALNAAVEAARAGETGKGFAVVSDEVRNLAIKSSNAAKNTTDLIEHSIKSIERGTCIAEETANALFLVVDIAKSVFEVMDKISKVTYSQDNSIKQVITEVDQISSVVQTNSATAEESAAASEELYAQAQVLKKLVSQFKLNDNYIISNDSNYVIDDINNSEIIYMKENNSKY